jgi:hypothetical protein
VEGDDWTGHLHESERLWLRSVVQQLRFGPLGPASTALIAHLVGGAPPTAKELPTTDAELDEVRRLVSGLPSHLAARATEVMSAYAANVGRGVPRPPPSPAPASHDRRTLLRAYLGGYVLEANGVSTVVVETPEGLLAELRAREVAEPDSVARVLRLVGSEVEFLPERQDLGRFVELELGIVNNRGPRPDVAGYELKTSLGSGSRPFMYLFGKAPTWLLARGELVRRYGTGGTLRTRVRGHTDESDARFRLVTSEDTARVVTRDGEGLMEWRTSELEARVRQKMPRMIKLTGQRDSQRHVTIVEGLVCADLRPHEFGRLLGHRDLYLNIHIPRSASKGTYEFFVNTTGLARLYRSFLHVRPA